MKVTESRTENPDCPCKRTKCKRHGNCAACREHHRSVRDNPTACERRIRKANRESGRREGERHFLGSHPAEDKAIKANEKTDIAIRQMTDGDLPLFEKWLSLPHVAKWYHDPEDWLRECKEKQTEFAFIHHFIALADSQPIGFCQYYACRDSGEDWNGYEPTDDAYSIDYLIGESAYLRRGYGKQIVSALIEKIGRHPDAKRVLVQPERGNEASRALLLSCGFSHDAGKDLYIRLIGGRE